MDAGVYECTADNQYSVDRRSFKTDFSIAFDWITFCAIFINLSINKHKQAYYTQYSNAI